MQTVKIKDLGKIVTGKTPSTKKPELFGDVYPFITPSDISSYDVYHVQNTERGLSEKGYLSQKSKLLPPKTVCYVCIGSTVGKICLTKESSFTNQQLNNIIVDRSRYVPEYIYYRLRYETPRIRSIAGGTGSGKAIYNKTAFEEHRLEIHDYPLQQKIASVLSAYDDLIENNLRRIKILEEMARLIYQEWFVNFRFPGYEKAKFVNSELGKIPEGWILKSADEALDINPKISVQKDDFKPFISMGDLQINSMVVNYSGLKKGTSGSKFQNGDTLMARITPCLENGKTCFVQCLPEKAIGIGSTEFIVLRSKTLCSEFVYLLARSESFRNNAIKSMTGASGRQRVQPQCFGKFLFAHPEKSILAKFETLVKPMFREVHLLAKKNTNLKKSRDILLPKLISGELDVSELDIDTGDINEEK